MVDTKTIINPGAIPQQAPPQSRVKGGAAGGPSFRDFLQAATVTVAPPAQKAELSFSQHAVKRLAQRNIQFSPAQMSRLNEALGRARAKGSRESLFITREAALVVGVKQGIVITAMDRNDLRDQVITNIDATVMVD